MWRRSLGKQPVLILDDLLFLCWLLSQITGVKPDRNAARLEMINCVFQGADPGGGAERETRLRL